MKKVVIIGDGFSAINAALEIRIIDKEIDIEIYSEYSIRAYDSMNLPNYIIGEIDFEKLIEIDISDLTKMNIKCFENHKIHSLDEIKASVKFENEKEVEFDYLILAMDNNVVIPIIKGITKNNIFIIDEFETAKDLKSKLTDFNSISIIGIDLFSINLASKLARLKKSVNLLISDKLIFSRYFDKKASDIFIKYLNEIGVKIYLDDRVKEFTGTKDVKKTHLYYKEKVINNDLVIFSSQHQPDVSFFNNSTSIKVNVGIVVDDYLKSSINNIYVVGPYVEHHNRLYNFKNIYLEQCRLVANNLYNENKKKFKVSSFERDIIEPDLSLYIKGETDIEGRYENIMIIDENENIYKKIVISNEKIIGILFIGTSYNDYNAITEHFGEKINNDIIDLVLHNN